MRIDEVQVTKFLDEIGLRGHSKDDQEAVAEAFALWVTKESLGRARVIAEQYPKNPPPGTISLTSLRTNIYVNAQQIRDAQAFVILAGIAALQSGELHTIGAAVLIAELQALWKKVGRLTEDQSEAARRLARLANGRSIYDHSISLAEYLSQWPDIEHRRAKELLDELKDLGVVRESLNGYKFAK